MNTVDDHPHAFVRGAESGPARSGPPEETCAICGRDPRNEVHMQHPINDHAYVADRSGLSSRCIRCGRGAIDHSIQMRLTIDLSPDPQHPSSSWVATCTELGVTSASSTPQLAISALASAVRTVVNGIMEKRSLTNAADGIAVMQEITDGYARTIAKDGDIR